MTALRIAATIKRPQGEIDSLVGRVGIAQRKDTVTEPAKKPREFSVSNAGKRT